MCLLLSVVSLLLVSNIPFLCLSCFPFLTDQKTLTRFHWLAALENSKDRIRLLLLQNMFSLPMDTLAPKPGYCNRGSKGCFLFHSLHSSAQHSKQTLSFRHCSKKCAILRYGKGPFLMFKVPSNPNLSMISMINPPENSLPRWITEGLSSCSRPLHVALLSCGRYKKYF